MSLFRKKQPSAVPRLSDNNYEPVLRCSICNGEQVLCLQNRETGELHELMLIRSARDLDEFCRANAIKAADIRKIY